MQMIRKLNVAVLLWSVATGAAFAQVEFNANLQPSSEVPPTTSKGSGTVQATLDPSTKMLKWTVKYEGLTGPATAAHFHGPAAVGVNAGVQVPAQVPAEPSGQVTGEAPVTKAQIDDIEAGQWYFNVHTAKYKGGEIRGQLKPAH